MKPCADTNFFTRVYLSLPESDQADRLVEMAKRGFRTCDILHVVSARLFGCDHFFSFDARASRLAQIEGLEVAPV